VTMHGVLNHSDRNTYVLFKCKSGPNSVIWPISVWIIWNDEKLDIYSG